VFKKVIGQQPVESAPARQPEPVRFEPHSAPPLPTSHSGSQPASHRPSTGIGRNVLSSDVEIKGIVKFTNDLVVDGKIEGEIHSDGNLTIGENARIKAEIKTGTLVVYGKIHGNIIVTDRVELKSSSEVVGDIKTKILAIEPGAIFVGKSTVGTPTSTPAPVSKPLESPKSDPKQGQLTSLTP
jgi:cytoskeletal protein CcmA (bactofilin family)